MINQEEAAKAWSEYLADLHNNPNRYGVPNSITMTDKASTEKTSPDKSKPKVRDEFLADLIREFGAEYGVELYQAGTVTKEDLASFTVLRDKFGVEVKPRPVRFISNAYEAVAQTTRPRRQIGTSPD